MRIGNPLGRSLRFKQPGQPKCGCGGLEINGKASLSPGVYVVKDGSLKVDKGGELVGDEVGFLLTGDKPIADESKYTVILAREFVLGAGPEVVLSNDYALSDVPLPEGVGNKAHPAVRLTK